MGQTCTLCFPWKRIEQEIATSNEEQRLCREKFLEANAVVKQLEQELAELLDEDGNVVPECKGEFELGSEQLKVAIRARSDYRKDFKEWTANSWALKRGKELSQVESKKKGVSKALIHVKENVERASDAAITNSDTVRDTLDSIQASQDEVSSTDLLLRDGEDDDKDEATLKIIRAVKHRMRAQAKKVPAKEELKQTNGIKYTTSASKPAEVLLPNMPKVYTNRKQDVAPRKDPSPHDDEEEEDEDDDDEEERERETLQTN